ncbi:MAG TPA: hypothetical protein VMA36_02945 [Candidatus Limnocylindria bacterium]|nr:hypothetical protein [Candidatus Limnocylindria bacterium]
MQRFHALNTLAYVLAAGLALTACGGGGSHGTIPAASTGATSPGGGATVQSASGTFTFSIPKPTSSSTARKPQYISSATKSVSLTVTDTKNHQTGTDIYANVPASLKAMQVANFANLTGNPTTPGQCGTDPSNTGNYKCTAVFQLPVGDNTVTITSWDTTGGTGNKLSQQIATLTTSQGAANTYAVTLDGNVSTMAVSASGSCSAGAVGASFGTVGTTAVTFSASYTDLAGKTITAPGLPQLSVTTSGVTGGTIGISVNQSAQTFTLTPSAAGVSGTVNVSAAPPSGSDGLSFSTSKSFTFSSGAAPPSSFLAVVEQTTASSGEIDFYTVALGASDTFAAYSTPTLAVTNSTNEGIPDVNGPQAALFNDHGDLLIANGAGGSGGTGSLACIPVGAIATGANTATTVETDVDDPQSIAYDSRDESVALANNPAAAPYNLAEYLNTSGNYAASATRDIANPTHALGDNAVIAVPGLPAGTYAAALTTGTPQAPHGTGSSKIALLSPSGAETDITDPTIDDPTALAWDATNSQLVIANGSVWTYSLDFYTVAPVAKVKTISNGFQYYAVATSPDGHVAVAQVGLSPDFQVQVYDNTSARNAVGGPIPFNGTTASNGGNYIYDTGTWASGPSGTEKITAMTWLSNTKLLIALTTQATGKQGLYIFDVSTLTVPAGYDDTTGNAFAAAPSQTGFQATAKTPFGVAYKP